VGALKLAAAVAVAVLAHFVGMALLPEVARLVDFLLIVVILHALAGRSLSALFLGFAAGLFYDSLASGPFGLFGFADTIVGYAAARIAQRLVIQRPSGVLAVVGFASALQQTIVVVLTYLLLPSAPATEPLWTAVARAGLTGIAGMVVYLALIQGRRVSEARRRGRMSRLRLG
jgi:rod shape-determining protein MreD